MCVWCVHVCESAIDEKTTACVSCIHKSRKVHSAPAAIIILSASRDRLRFGRPVYLLCILLIITIMIVIIIKISQNIGAEYPEKTRTPYRVLLNDHTLYKRFTNHAYSTVYFHTTMNSLKF